MSYNSITNVSSLEDLLLKYHMFSKEMRWDMKPEELYDPFRYIMDQKGKKMRPISLLLSSSFFNSDLTKALPLAYAIELFHNFTLVHDDIMDNAETRRGKKSVHVEFGTNLALLSGDAMLLEACKLIQQNSSHHTDILKHFLETALDVCKGQCIDMNFERREIISIPEYLEMIKLKTAVLLGTALKMGAQLHDQNEIIQEQLYHLGINLGLAFQIQDDILDCYGDEEAFGKKRGGDLIQHKKSILILCALEKLNPQEKHKFIDEYHSERSDIEQLHYYLDYFKKYNIKEDAEKHYDHFKKLCYDIISQIKIDEKFKPLLQEFVSLIINRSV
ncbi:MAG: polyprenyl synthetase family protein [Saprospiraceae bacterium]|nr:polyprenyl synthetase family protein [Saprospiraceae bacterium]